MTKRSALAVLAALVVVLASTASAQASTEAERRSWAEAYPKVSSHGQTQNQVCPGRRSYRRDDGTTATLQGGCGDNFSAIRVHREGRIAVQTPAEAESITIGIETTDSRGWRTGLRNDRACGESSPGRWDCPMPPPDSSGQVVLVIDYPGARAVWDFTYLAHKPTEDERAQWVETAPTIASHDQRSRHICFAGGNYRDSDGGDVVVEGGDCTANYDPIPVHEGGVVSVQTPLEARRVVLSADRPRPLRRACGQREPGRWLCSMPPPGSATSASVSITFPQAGSSWSFDIDPHPPGH